MSSKPKPPTPARLSAISTSLLTSILELSQQNSLELPVNPSTKAAIVRNLISLRDGLVELGVADGDEIIGGLRKQYGRIVGLVNGVGGMEDQIAGLDLGLPSPASAQPLIDVSGSAGQSSEASSAENTHAQSPSDGPSSERTKSHAVHIEIPNRPRSRQMVEEDEALMRAQNEEVQIMQRVLLDDQDRTLDQLSSAISRQRDLSLHISSELEVQENLLDELDESMDFTSGRLRRANKRMDHVFQRIAKDGACWTIFGLVAVLLFLIILLK